MSCLLSAGQAVQTVRVFGLLSPRAAFVLLCLPLERKLLKQKVLITQLSPSRCWTVACQALLSMGFSRQEYWSGLPFPPPGDLPDPRIKPGSSKLQADSLPSELPRQPPSKQSNSLTHLIYNVEGMKKNLKLFNKEHREKASNSYLNNKTIKYFNQIYTQTLTTLKVASD